MKNFVEFMCEALASKNPIDAFEWQVGGTHIIIDYIIQQLKSNGFKEVSGRTVNTHEYNLSHNGACLCVGLKGKHKPDRREHRHTVFIRQDVDGKVDITAKHSDPDGLGTWYTGWVLNSNKFRSVRVTPNNMFKRGYLEDTVENATKILEKILSRTDRYIA